MLNSTNLSACPVPPGVVLPDSLIAAVYGTANSICHNTHHLDLKQLHAPARENQPAHENGGLAPTHITVQMGQPVDALIDVYHCDWCESAFIDVLVDAGLPCYQGFEVRFTSGAFHTAQGATYCAECAAMGEILRCRVCGCTDAAGCAEGCGWAQIDADKGDKDDRSLCTACSSGEHVGEDEEADDAPGV